jgi:hypothetical protein
MLIIGVGSKARQGKDSVAKVWHDLNSDVKFYSFANALKEECKRDHDKLLPMWQLAHQTKQFPGFKEDPIYGCTPILQWWGTKVRETDPDHWVNIVAAKILDDFPRIAVITDVRFPNEAEWIDGQGGFLVEVIRTNQDGTRYFDKGRDPKHISETALDDYLGWDYIIRCKDGEMQALYEKATTVFNNIQYDHVNDQINHNRVSVPDATGNSAYDPFDQGGYLEWGNESSYRPPRP